MVGLPVASSWAELVGSLVVVVAAYVALHEARVAARSVRELRTFEHDRMIDELADTRHRIEDVLQRGSGGLVTREVVDGILKVNPEFEIQLRRVLDRYETYAMPICAGLADEDVAFECSGSSIVWWGTATAPYIADLRDRLQFPALYTYLTHLADRWQLREQEDSSHLIAHGLPYFIRRKRRRSLLTRRW